MIDGSLQWREISALFTAVICIDQQGQILFQSDLVKKYIPRELDGMDIFDVFEFKRPRAVRNLSNLREHLGSLSLITCHDKSFGARGQFVEAVWEGQTVLCFCGSPWLFWMDENCPDVKLGMSDFSPQDSQLDQLFLMSAEQRMVADLEKLNEDLQAAKRETELAQESKNAFFARMSHEMRTPLNGVVSALSLLDDENLDAGAGRLLTLAQSSSRNLLQVINYILDVSKIETGGAEIESNPIHLPRLLKSVTDIVRARAEERGLELHWRADETLSEVFLGDKSKLRQCLLNLVTNAIKFTRAGVVIARVLPSTDLENSFVRFEVEDTGIGISAEDQKRIFEPFWISEARLGEDESSTGLGLDILRRNVELMGGQLGVTSEEGKGSVFWFEIPLKASTGAIDDGAPVSVRKTEVPDRFAGRVLLVDDNSTNMLLGRMILESMGVEVDEARNGAEATDKALLGIYDLVLMDISMPIMDGVAATQRIREQHSATELPIVALSAYASSKEEQRCAEAGMNDYLTKPIVRERLAEQLSRWLAAADDPENIGDRVGDSTATAPDASKALDLEVLQKLQEQIGAANVSTVLDQFADEVNDRWLSLEHAFQEDDLSRAIRETHTLASTCRSLGLADAGNNFSVMEDSMRDAEALPGDLQDAREYLDRGLQALTAYRTMQ